jgi:adenylate kinase family enzyme
MASKCTTRADGPREGLLPDCVRSAWAGKGTQADRLRIDFRLLFIPTGDIFMLDGFPRTIEQATALDRQLEELKRRVTAVIVVDVPYEEVVGRLSGRRVCVKAGHNYHVEFDPPKRQGVCDQDGSRLFQRFEFTTSMGRSPSR